MLKTVQLWLRSIILMQKMIWLRFLSIRHAHNLLTVNRNRPYDQRWADTRVRSMSVSEVPKNLVSESASDTDYSARVVYTILRVRIYYDPKMYLTVG